LEETTTPSTDTSSQKNKRIAKNTLMLYFRMILTMLVSLYTSRVVLNTLGVEDFGIYNVVGGVVMMFAFFNSAMSSATQRFISFELGKGNFVQLRKTFNASQIIHIGIAVLIFVIAETVGIWFVKIYMVIPSERMEAAIWVYHFSVLSFMVSIIQVPYNATIIAHERMNVYAYVSILEVLLKLLIVFMLTWITYDKLKLYAILNLVVTYLIASIYRVYTRRNFKESKFEVVKDKKLFKTLISYSGWNLFGNIAGVAQGQGINIILNIFFGPVLNAARGIATQVQSAVNSFVNNFQVAVNPQIIKSYAANEKEYMISLIIQSSKYSFYLLFLLSLPIILEVDQILKLWLITVPEYAPIFTILVLIVILITSISGPLKIAVQATGKVAIYQAVIGTLLFLTLPISYVFLKSGYPPEVTLYITIAIEIIALIFRLFFLKKLINFPVFRFIKEIIFRNIPIILLSTSLPLLVKKTIDENIWRLLIVVCVSLIWNSIVIYYVGLKTSEQKVIQRGLKKILQINKG
jgi:O-antigen/teichoic acid export membrane protein